MYNCWNEALAYIKNKDGSKKKSINKDTYELIEILMRQYYYGIQAKKELFYLLIDLGVIKEGKDLEVSI